MTSRDNGRRRPTTAPPPRGSNDDRDAIERAVLGACLVGNADAVAAARRMLPLDPFFRPRHGVIWRAICSLVDDDQVPDPVTVPARVKQMGDRWAEPDDRLYVLDLYATAPAILQMDWYAKELRQYAMLRRLVETGARMQQLGESGDLDRAAELVESSRASLDELAAVSLGAVLDPEVTEIDQLLAEEDDEYEWILPGLLERGDRVILTGAEGRGKSTLLRQIAIMCAAGIHPFNLGEVPPLKVLVVDLENTRRQFKRKARAVRAKAGAKYDPHRDPGMHVRFRVEGIDLLGNAMIDGHWLLDLAKDLQPDLLITGPIYKMAGGDPLDEQTAKAITRWLDLIRKEVGCAILIEAHSPYPNGKDKRPLRPYGASLWSRWPEFGIHLDGDTGLLSHWRGPRDERQWPGGLKRGGEWPWTVATEEEVAAAARAQRLAERAQRGDDPEKAAAKTKILMELKRAGGTMSMKDLEAATEYTRQTLSRHLNELVSAKLVDEIDQGKGRPKLWMPFGAADDPGPEEPEPGEPGQMEAF